MRSSTFSSSRSTLNGTQGPEDPLLNPSRSGLGGAVSAPPELRATVTDGKASKIQRQRFLSDDLGGSRAVVALNRSDRCTFSGSTFSAEKGVKYRGGNTPPPHTFQDTITSVGSSSKMSAKVPLSPLPHGSSLNLPKADVAISDTVYAQPNYPKGSRSVGGKLTSKAPAHFSTSLEPLQKTPPPKSQAQALASLRPLHIDSSSSAIEQKQKLADWVDSFSNEMSLQDASSVTIELMLQQVMDATKHLPPPNHLRLAAVCLLCERVTGVIHRYGPILNTLFQELYGATFLPLGAAVPREEFVADRLSAMGVHPDSGIQRYLARKPYFEAFTETISRQDTLSTQVTHLTECIERQARVIDVSCQAWQKLLVMTVFNAWRGSARKQRHKTRALDSFVQKHRRRDVLLTHFYAWRTVLLEDAGERTRQECSDGIEQLIQKEATSNVKLQEAEDNLEETRMLAVRLREEKLEFTQRSQQLLAATESALYKANEWRDITVDSVNFITSMRQVMGQIRDVGGPDFSKCGELAVTVILGWVKSVIQDLPKAQTVKCSNFGSDLRDGKVFIMLMHVITNGEVELLNLSHKDPLKRMAIVFDAINNLKLNLPITADDLSAAPSDYNFLILFSLWWHFALPPTPTQDVCIGTSGGFRDDLSATKTHLDECRQFYPRWLEHRAILQQYALFVLCCRAKGKPAKVLSAEEDKEMKRDLTLFAVRTPNKIPDVFLSTNFLTPHQRQENEEERQRCNDVINKHISLIRSTFEFYALQSIVDDGKKKKKKKKETSSALQLYGVIDFTGFYRLCDDCRLICAVEQKRPEPAPEGKKKKGPKSKKDDEPPEPEEPWKMTKSQCFQLFTKVTNRFQAEHAMSSSVRGGNKSLSGLNPDAKMMPPEFIAALLEVAIHRHGAPLLPSSEQPAPGSMAFDKFINQDMAPYACVSGSSPFKTEAWSVPVQQVLQKARKTLMPLFELFAGLDGDGTMNFEEFSLLLKDTGVLEGPYKKLLTKKVMAQIFNQFESSGDERTDEEHAAAAAVASEAFTAVTPDKKPVAPAQGDAAPEGDSKQEEEEEEDPHTGAGSHEMVYGEFEMALICVSVFVNPAPYIPLAARLEAFLSKFLVTAAKIVKADEKKKHAAAEAQKAAAEEQARRELLEAQAEKKRLLELVEKQRQEDLIKKQLEEYELEVSGGK